MAWSKGESGNPGGRPSYKPITEAVTWALKLPPKELKKRKGKTAAQAMALSIINEAVNNANTNAFKAVGDRVEGTPTQSVRVNSAAPQITFNMYSDATLLKAWDILREGQVIDGEAEELEPAKLVERSS